MSRKVKKYQWGEDPQLSGPRNFFRESLIIKYLRKYVKKGRILDAGCGNGSLSLRITENKTFSVYAIDLSEQSISFFKDIVHKKRIKKRVTIKHGSLYKLPYKAHFFNGVVCGEVLEHLKNDTKALREFFRVLKPRGYCIVTVPAKEELWDITDNISDHMRRYTKNNLVDKFEAAGFSVEKAYYWGFPFSFLWHKYIFLPFLVKKMNKNYNITSSKSPISTLVKNNFIQKMLSYPFYLDNFFNFTQLGNALVIVAVKK